MTEKLGKRILKSSLPLTIYVLLLEILVKINTTNDFDWSYLRITLSSIIIGLFLGYICSLFRKTAKNIIETIIAFGLLIYTWVEINLFNYMGFFMGVGNAEQGTKITDYISDFIKASTFISYLVIVPFIIYLLYIWWIRTAIRRKKLSKTVLFVFKKEKIVGKSLTTIVTFILIAVFCFAYYLSLTTKKMQNKTQSIDNDILFLTSDNSNLNVSQFGLMPYCISDLIVTGFDIEVDADVDIDFSNNNNTPVVETDYTRKIDDSAWKVISDEETNSTYKKLNEYFMNREITPKNDYTGIFEGKNLIVMLLESTNLMAINEEEYPTIYKMYTEGISFRNNYSPRNNCSTGNNEMTVMTSLFTINNTCTANRYKTNVYPEAIFSVFNNAGYKTTSYHDYTEAYYYRRTIHPNMGSGKYYGVKDLGIKYSAIYEEWPSDVDLIKNAYPLMQNDEGNFMAFLVGVTTHQPYTVDSENGNKHLDEFSDTKYAKPVKRWLSKMKEVDAALAELLKTLEENGQLENTVIALFADHYPYGLTTSQINTVLDYDVKVNKEVDRTPMLIYNAGTEAKVVEKYTSIIDLLPTLLNMFNLDYDSRLYLGHDIFSDYEARTVFADGSWQNEKGYYSATNGKFKAVDKENTYTDEELIKINNEINTRQKMSALAIKNDYFNYRNKKITKHNEKLEAARQASVDAAVDAVSQTTEGLTESEE